ncbi:MAG: nitrogen fixation protein NifU [Candidatus Berkelbacteria bacterium Licking1014_2]|uniref:Nitrogen fixation protein NifU n=1 Tax=Candidatus Berkelbacteria bacterium Licking1014_2 TaxID=2017146 RepID=A0A554LTT4_9BACT|nr:MAG: nitrogen fixation protein NifU [Candidatus Berkelbacteria bacterium Licking1014_2]
MDKYNKKTIERFARPKNYGQIDNPDGVGQVGNIICGDIMKLYLKIGKNKAREEIIKDIKFETLGCVAAIATSGMITELAKGKILTEALKIDRQEIVDSLGGLPPAKIHCSVLAIDALAEAIYDYYRKNSRSLPQSLRDRHERIEEEKRLIEKKYGKWFE